MVMIDETLFEPFIKKGYFSLSMSDEGGWLLFPDGRTIGPLSVKTLFSPTAFSRATGLPHLPPRAHMRRINRALRPHMVAEYVRARLRYGG